MVLGAGIVGGCGADEEVRVSWWQALLWGTPAEERPIQPAQRVLLAEAGSVSLLLARFEEVQRAHRRAATTDLPVRVSAVVEGWVGVALGPESHPFVLHDTASRLHHDHGVRALAWSVADDPRYTYVLGPDPRGGWRMMAGWRRDGGTVSVSRENNQVFHDIDLGTAGSYDAMFEDAGVPDALRVGPDAWQGAAAHTLRLPDFGREKNPDLRILTPDDAHLGVVDIEMRFRSGAR